MKPRRLTLILAAALLTTGCGTKSAPPATSRTGWSVSSPDFGAGETMPARHGQAGGNVSPTLVWSPPPPGTQSVAIIMDDPDAPGTEPFVHWLVADLAPQAGLRTGQSPVTEGKNSTGETGYFGPKPPSGVHHYHFRVFALDKKLGLAAGFSRPKLEAAMKGHILDETEMVGLFKAS